MRIPDRETIAALDRAIAQTTRVRRLVRDGTPTAAALDEKLNALRRERARFHLDKEIDA